MRMLKLDGIKKSYGAKDNAVEVLRGLSLSFRDSEFVSILGPSGCGKTTLLNIVGGLDRYNDGDLVIDGVSTKDFRDRDWDAYRNRTIGFVFQSYNLIGHQSVIDNVAVALTLSGVGRAERHARAMEALKSVGLAEHAKKRPNQLSGGQMQRVAIARALVNNPRVILADEPTGALDSNTSVQVMEILREVAKERLVIMVTHNADLAEEYSTRIVKMNDGEVVSDSNPLSEEEASKTDMKLEKYVEMVREGKEKKTKRAKTSMSYPTALKLSFKNLLTKKTRTLLTAFAGSIGIIGIAMILAITNGMNYYIGTMQRDLLSTFPLEINRVSMVEREDFVLRPQPGYVGPNLSRLEPHFNLLTRDFLDFVDQNITPLASEVTRIYDTQLSIMHLNQQTGNIRLLGQSDTDTTNPARNVNVFQLPPESVLSNMYDVVATIDVLNIERPEARQGCVCDLEDDEECVEGCLTENYAPIPLTLVLDRFGRLNTNVVELLTGSRTAQVRYQDLFGQEFRLAYNPGIFELRERDDVPDGEGGYRTVRDFISPFHGNNADPAGILETWNHEEYSRPMYISRIIRPRDENMFFLPLGSGIAVPNGLREEIAYDQRTQAFADVLFDEYYRIFNEVGLSNIDDLATALAEVTRPIFRMQGISLGNFDQLGAYFQLLIHARAFGLDLFCTERGFYLPGMEEFAGLTSGIHIFTSTFDAQDRVKELLAQWNAKPENQHNQIHYDEFIQDFVDMMGQMISMISLVLIGISAISLVVSTLMIGIITYVSVLERTREIGILRSVGARKRDIRRVFAAETAIIGFVAGVIGIVTTLILGIPVNIVVNAELGVPSIVSLPVWGALGLIALSCALTVLSGFFPSRVAAKRDPVKALRSE